MALQMSLGILCLVTLFTVWLVTVPVLVLMTLILQILADPRVRVEQRLRDAGLQTTDYARQVMTQVRPVHPPRRDAESSILK